MQTISINYKGRFNQLSLKIKKTMWAHKRQPDGSGHKVFSNGVVETYVYLLFLCWKAKSNFCYVSMERIAHLHGVHMRTVQRWMKVLLESGFISKGRRWVNNDWRHGWFLCAHPEIVDLLQRLDNVTVKFSDEEAEDYDDFDSDDFNDFEDSGNKGSMKNGSLNETQERQIDTNSNNAKQEEEPPITQKTRQTSECLPSPLIYKEQNIFNSPLPPKGSTAAGAAEERDGFASPPFASKASVEEAAKPVITVKPATPEVDNQLWLSALALLKASIPESEYKLWFASIRAQGDFQSLQIICSDKFVCSWIRDHYGKSIENAMQQLGVQQYRIIEAPYPVANPQKENAEILENKKIEEEKERERINRLSVNEQFHMVMEIYPRKTIGEYKDHKTFCRMKRCGQLPETYDLIKLIKNFIGSENWIKNNGRWIPSFCNFLNQRPWWKAACA